MQKKTVKALKILEKEIISGTIGISGFLPPERDLCQKFDIGRGSLQAVFAELAAKKLIRKVPGKGMRILNKDAQGKSRKYMMIIPEGSIEVAEIFETLRGIATAADRESAEAIMFFYRPETSGKKLLARLNEGSIDGVIMIERHYEEVVELLQQFDIPYVIANYERAPQHFAAAQVDFRQIGRSAGRFLVQKGHRHIGFIGDRSSYLYRELFAGLKGALAEDDLAPVASMCIELSRAVSEEKQHQEVCAMLKKHISSLPHIAIFAGRDRYARLIWQCCQDLKLDIPGDVSVIGYDNITWPEGEKQQLTTISQPAFQIGQAAFHAVSFAAENNAAAESAFLPGELIERSSVKNICGEQK